MENMDYRRPDCAPRRPCEPSPVTTREFMTAWNHIEVEHQNNVEFLKDPYPTIDYDDFCKRAETAQKLAQDLSVVEREGLPSPPDRLAYGQEVIFYGTSRLRTAVTAWIQARQDETYNQTWVWWMTWLRAEMVSGDWYIYLAANTIFSGHFLRPLVFMPVTVLADHPPTHSSWR